MPDIRYVVVHHPGPRWQAGLPLFEQEGLQDHVEHYRQLLSQGKLALGGPFLDAAAGGMMVPSPGLDEAEIRAFAAADPAIVSGLLTFELRQWMVGMQA